MARVGVNVTVWWGLCFHACKPMALCSHNAGNFLGVLDFDFTKDDPEVACRNVTIDGKAIDPRRLERSWLE